MKKYLLAAAALALVAPAFAHGDVRHKAGSPVTKEQKAWGVAGEARAVKRTIEVTMSDNMRFTPDSIEVRQDEVVRLVIRNGAQLLHEFVLGTRQELDQHAALMLKFPNMEHDEPYMAHVPPGTTQEMIWNFNRPGQFKFACLVAGHYQAGMVGTITVAAASKK